MRPTNSQQPTEPDPPSRKKKKKGGQAALSSAEVAGVIIAAIFGCICFGVCFVFLFHLLARTRKDPDDPKTMTWDEAPGGNAPPAAEKVEGGDA